jgi:hypothetical protein
METLPVARSSTLVALLLASVPFPAAATEEGRTPLSAPLGMERGRRPAERERADYVVHEWGTFTSVLDSEGRALRWNALELSAPLPGFVHRSDRLKGGVLGTVRMETPVLYFHAQRELTVDARVGFPGGILTEWYPAADTGAEALAWHGVEVQPGLDVLLPSGLAGEHYYAARGVDSAHVRARSGEAEKFLFYRGVGSFEQPLAVRTSGAVAARAIELENRGTEALDRVLLFERRGGQVGLLALGPLAPGATRRVARAELALSADVSLAPLEALLRAHGLFADEAQAMIATWRADWFEPGLRALYVVPRARTDALLPLTLTPAPRALERVLVGRLELFEPELERAILEAARAVRSGGSRPLEAFAPLGERLTRFALALLQDRREHEPALEAVEPLLAAHLARHD